MIQAKKNTPITEEKKKMEKKTTSGFLAVKGRNVSLAKLFAKKKIMFSFFQLVLLKILLQQKDRKSNGAANPKIRDG